MKYQQYFIEASAFGLVKWTSVFMSSSDNICYTDTVKYRYKRTLGARPKAKKSTIHGPIRIEYMNSCARILFPLLYRLGSNKNKTKAALSRKGKVF